MRFLADMGVSQRVVSWLRNEGHDALHVREENLLRLPNGLIFEKAYSEKRILLTFDLDFGEIVALSGGRNVSVILFRLRNTRTQHVIDRLKNVLIDARHALEQGAIVVVEEARHRIRRLPLGS
jgi:predicted nuclease of predicted toxin-antitoxin system